MLTDLLVIGIICPHLHCVCVCVCVCSKDNWGNPEGYILVVLAIIYAYHLVMLVRHTHTHKRKGAQNTPSRARIRWAEFWAEFRLRVAVSHRHSCLFTCVWLLSQVFGNVHCVFMACDVTSKDCISTDDVRKNPPCFPGTRSPLWLAANLHALCCAPIKPRPSTIMPV